MFLYYIRSRNPSLVYPRADSGARDSSRERRLALPPAKRLFQHQKYALGDRQRLWGPRNPRRGGFTYHFCRLPDLSAIAYPHAPADTRPQNDPRPPKIGQSPPITRPLRAVADKLWERGLQARPVARAAGAAIRVAGAAEHSCRPHWWRAASFASSCGVPTRGESETKRGRARRGCTRLRCGNAWECTGKGRCVRCSRGSCARQARKC